MGGRGIRSLRASPPVPHRCAEGAEAPPCILQAMLHEFKLDYNQKHFVRNETFKKAADRIQVSHPMLSLQYSLV